MSMIHRFILSCLFMLGVTSLQAQDTYVRDSLLMRLENASQSQDRLPVLLKLSKVTLENLAESQQYADKLLDEAKTCKDMYYMCQAYLMQEMIAYNSYNAEEVQRLAKILMPLARQQKYYDEMFKAWRCSLDFLILSQDFEQNEKEAKLMLKEAQELKNTVGIIEASQVLANTYRATYRKKEAIEVLENVLPLAYQQGNTANIYNLWQPLFFLYSETREYAKWIEGLNSLKAYMYNLPPYEFRTESGMLLILHTSYLDYYTKTKNWEKARDALKTAEPFYAEVNSPLYRIIFDRNACDYYYDTGQYSKALEKVNKALAGVESLSARSDYNQLLLLKAYILADMQRYTESAQIYRQQITYNDSLQTSTINKQYEQLKKDFNANQLMLENARLKFRLQFCMVLLLGIGLLVVVGFIVYLLRSHRMLRKAEEEMRTMTERVELANDAKNRFLSNISTTIREPLNTVVDGSMRLASDRIEDSVKRQQLSLNIRRMAGNLLKMINDILDLSRLEAGMMKFDVRESEVSSLLYDALCAMETPANRIEIRPEYPENTLFMVNLDAERLQQVFKSLFVAEKTENSVVTTVREENKTLYIQVVGSILAQRSTSQEIIIRNEINSMLLARFGGSYIVSEKPENERKIEIILPIGEVLHA